MSSTNVATSPTIVPGKVTTVELPPCRICGEKASGFHYGVNTCEACKGFFRRCLIRKVSDKCRSKNGCDIIPGQRHSYCATCRYKKCLREGMSKNAIKTGRYTHEKRTKNTKEVEILKEKVKTEINQEMKIKREKEKELERFIEDLTENHIRHIPNDKKYHIELHQREQELQKHYAAKEAIYGNTVKMTPKQYNIIYESTGIDIDGRREWLKQMIPRMETSVKRFITFAKCLPGFKDLPVDDKVALIKVTRNHTELLRWSHLLSRECDVFYSPHVEDFAHYNDYKRMLPDHHEQLDLMTSLFERVQDLELTPSEQAVLAALSVLNGPVTVSHVGWLIRDNMVDKLGYVLMYLLAKRTDTPGVVFGKLINILVELETLDEKYLAYMEASVLINYPGTAKPENLKIWLELTGLYKEAMESFQQGFTEYEELGGSNMASLIDYCDVFNGDNLPLI